MPKSRKMRSRSRSRSRRGGMWPFDSASTGSSYDATQGSTSGSWWDKLTGKKPQTGMNQGASYGSTDMNQGYGSTGMNQGYGSTGMNQGYGSTGMSQGYGSTGMNQGYGSTDMNQGYGSTGMSQGYGSTGMSQGVSSYGGKRRRMRGGYSPNMSLTNLASSASPISDVQTVKAQTWVGGKSKRRRHGKSCKKSCRKH
jgi:hypothetical protein